MFFKHQWIEEDVALRPGWSESYYNDCYCNSPLVWFQLRFSIGWFQKIWDSWIHVINFWFFSLYFLYLGDYERIIRTLGQIASFNISLWGFSNPTLYRKFRPTNFFYASMYFSRCIASPWKILCWIRNLICSSPSCGSSEPKIGYFCSPLCELLDFGESCFIFTSSVLS